MMRGSVPWAPAVRRWMRGEMAMARSSVSGELVASRLTRPTLRRAPVSGISHIHPSGTISTLMFPVSDSSRAISGARPW